VASEADGSDVGDGAVRAGRRGRVGGDGAVGDSEDRDSDSDDGARSPVRGGGRSGRGGDARDPASSRRDGKRGGGQRTVTFAAAAEEVDTADSAALQAAMADPGVAARYTEHVFGSLAAALEGGAAADDALRSARGRLARFITSALRLSLDKQHLLRSQLEADAARYALAITAAETEISQLRARLGLALAPSNSAPGTVRDERVAAASVTGALSPGSGRGGGGGSGSGRSGQSGETAEGARRSGRVPVVATAEVGGAGAAAGPQPQSLSPDRHSHGQGRGRGAADGSVATPSRRVADAATTSTAAGGRGAGSAPTTRDVLQELTALLATPAPGTAVGGVAMPPSKGGARGGSLGPGGR